jgi:plasmid replication initiation protein
MTFTGRQQDVYGTNDVTDLPLLLGSKSTHVKKHVAIIHCANRLSLLEHKISNAFLYNAYHKLLTNEEHTIHIKDLCDLIGYDSKDYKLLKNAIKSLMSTVLEWNLLAKNYDNIWVASTVLADVVIKGSMCTYSYSRKVRELLFQPEMYAKIDLKTQAKFTSSYGLTLYENCIRFLKVNKTPCITLDIFRKLMGVEQGKYKNFGDFKKRVINIAVHEVNCFSPIQVVPSYIKKGRVVDSIRFDIHKKNNNDTKEVEQSTRIEDGSDLLSRLTNQFFIPRKEAISLIESYSSDYINEKIKNLLDSESFKKNSIKNVAGYLMTSILKDYKKNKTSFDLKEDLNKDRKIEEKIKKQAEISAKEKEDMYNSYIYHYFYKIIKEINSEKIDLYVNNFFDTFRVENKYMYNMVKSAYDNEGISCGKFIAFFKEYMIKLKICDAPISYEHFLLSIKNRE